MNGKAVDLALKVAEVTRERDAAVAKVARVEGLLDYIDGRDEHIAYQLRSALGQDVQQPTEVVDLVAALRASVEAAKRRREAAQS